MGSLYDSIDLVKTSKFKDDIQSYLKPASSRSNIQLFLM